MQTNRSIPCSTVIPELGYADVGEAAAWLCGAFGFTIRLRIANHRAQLNVGDGATAEGLPRWEAVANGDAGAAKGRELEFVELLAYLRQRHVRNVVWLTADVHYCAAHYYDPSKAAFRGFDPFWEFVAGPLNAGTFGPNALDGTFGPQLVFVKAPPPGQSNLSPYSGLQFFGEVNIDAQSRNLTVDFRDINGLSVFSQTLSPRGH